MKLSRKSVENAIIIVQIDNYWNCFDKKKAENCCQDHEEYLPCGFEKLNSFVCGVEFALEIKCIPSS